MVEDDLIRYKDDSIRYKDDSIESGDDVIQMTRALFSQEVRCNRKSFQRWLLVIGMNVNKSNVCQLG